MTTIVSTSKKFVFIHIPKTAGTSITLMLVEYMDHPLTNSKLVRNSFAKINMLGQNTFGKAWTKLMPQPLVGPFGRYVLPLHANAKYLQKVYADVDFSEYFKFTFVRNPWDLVVSNWKFVNARPSHHDHQVAKQMTFSDYVRVSKLGTQSSFLFRDSSGKIAMDYIGKIESLQCDFLEIARRLGITPRTVPRLNVTQKANYRDWYDKDTREIIYHRYREDIEAFEYEF